jgi:hypothetical protein
MVREEIVVAVVLVILVIVKRTTHVSLPGCWEAEAAAKETY